MPREEVASSHPVALAPAGAAETRVAPVAMTAATLARVACEEEAAAVAPTVGMVACAAAAVRKVATGAWPAAEVAEAAVAQTEAGMETAVAGGATGTVGSTLQEGRVPGVALRELVGWGAWAVAAASAREGRQMSLWRWPRCHRPRALRCTRTSEAQEAAGTVAVATAAEATAAAKAVGATAAAPRAACSGPRNRPCTPRTRSCPRKRSR